MRLYVDGETDETVIADTIIDDLVVRRVTIDE